MLHDGAKLRGGPADDAQGRLWEVRDHRRPRERVTGVPLTLRAPRNAARALHATAGNHRQRVLSRPKLQPADHARKAMLNPQAVQHRALPPPFDLQLETWCFDAELAMTAAFDVAPPKLGATTRLSTSLANVVADPKHGRPELGAMPGWRMMVASPNKEQEHQAKLAVDGLS